MLARLRSREQARTHKLVEIYPLRLQIAEKVEDVNILMKRCGVYSGEDVGVQAGLVFVNMIARATDNCERFMQGSLG